MTCFAYEAPFAIQELHNHVKKITGKPRAGERHARFERGTGKRARQCTAPLTTMPHHKPMVPSDFIPPDRVVTDHFTIRPLLFTDAEADYDAWSTSIEELQGIFGPDSNWPRKDMTLEENAIDLAWHQREHETAGCLLHVFDTDDKRCLGCIYLSPARKSHW